MSDLHLKPWQLTPVQKQGVVETGRRIVVTAGAGTGKTRVLTSRFAHLVLSNAARIDQILAITFTEKAAAEMAERVAGLFDEAGRPDLRRRLPEASISTIHAFCARLLREHAIEAGVDPAYEIVTDFEKDRLVEQALDLALVRIQSTQPDRYEHLTRTIRTEGRFGADILGAIRSIYENLRVGRIDMSNAFSVPDPEAEYNQILPRLREAIDRYLALAGKTKTTATMEANEQAIADLLAVLRNPEPVAVAKACPAVKIGMRLSRDLKPFAGEIRGLVKQLGQAAAELYAADTRALLSELIAAFDGSYAEAKQKASLLDFSDLEQRTLDLFDRRPDVLEAIQERFLFVMVDEFQDVNRLQADLIERLSRPGNLFVVGDHKQSIYAFRQADVRVFQEEVRKGGQAILSLRENFRSQKPILDFVNHYFEKAWAGLPDSLRYEPLTPGTKKQIPKNTAPAVELLATLTEPGNDIRAAEAETLAGRILLLMAGSKGRRYEPGEITVLFRAKTQVAAFLAELIRRHIPFQEVKGRGMFERAEVIDLQHYLEVLADPYDELALAAVLRSPFVQITEEALFHLCLAGREKEGGLYDACRQAERISELNAETITRLHRFLRIMDGFLSEAPRSSIENLVRRIFDTTGYRLWALTQPDAARKNGNMELCIHHAQDFAGPHGPTPGGLAAAIAEFRAQGSQAQDATVGDPGNSVTLMSVHAAKGLEAPVVILADCNHKEAVSSDPISYHPDAGVGFKVYLPDFTAVETKTLQAVKEAKKQEAEEEDLRLLYVAMTRARKRLILSCAMRPDARNHIGTYGWCRKILHSFDLDVNEYDQWPEILPWATNVAVSITKAEDLPAAPSAEKAKPAVREVEILQRYDSLPDEPSSLDGSRYLYSVSEITAHASCPRRFYLQYRVGLPIELLAEAESEEPFEDLEEPPSRIEAIDFGVAVHEMFAASEYPETPAWTEAARQIGNRHGMDPKEMDRALSILDAFARNPETQILSQARLYRELPFLWRREERLIRGKVDLLAVDGDRTWLVDYKTNRIGKGGPAALAARYQLQMTLYAMAVNALYNKPPDRVSLYLTETDRFVDVDCGPDAVAMAKRAIESILEADRNHSFPPRRERCPDCDHRIWCKPDGVESDG